MANTYKYIFSSFETTLVRCIIYINVTFLFFVYTEKCEYTQYIARNINAAKKKKNDTPNTIFDSLHFYESFVIVSRPTSTANEHTRVVVSTVVKRL